LNTPLNAPALSVVIPTYRRGPQLSQVLRACANQSLLPDDFEVVVSVDGDLAEAGPRQHLDHLALPFALRWASGPHGGPAAARNRGAAMAQGHVIVFLDDDVVPGRDCLAEHLQVHARDGGCRVGLGPVRLAGVGRPRSPWERYLSQRYDEHLAKLAAPGYRPTFWDCLSGNLSLDRALLARSGGFDGRLLRHEDVELGFRLCGLGARFVYRPGALAHHCFSRSLDGGLRDAFEEGVSAARLAGRHAALKYGLLDARWQRYRGPGLAGLRWALSSAPRHRRVARASRALLQRVEASALPAHLRRPAYQLACHLHFWLGVRSECEALLPA
jgi:GT2 family glycosyltransferase